MDFFILFIVFGIFIASFIGGLLWDICDVNGEDENE